MQWKLGQQLIATVFIGLVGLPTWADESSPRSGDQYTITGSLEHQSVDRHDHPRDPVPEVPDHLARRASSASPDTKSGSEVLEVTWHLIAGGGELRSGGGGYELSGTIGQPYLGRMTDGRDTVLIGGFWNESGRLFSDGFETGDIRNWNSSPN